MPDRPEKEPVSRPEPRPAPPPLPRQSAPSAPPLPRKAPPPRLPSARAAAPRPPKPAGYRADFSRVHAARLLALTLAPLVVFRLLPLGIGDVAANSAWGITSTAIAGLIAAHLLWMAITPDWSATRVCGWAFGASAVLYATAAGTFFFTPSWRGEDYDVATSFLRAALWCCAIALLDALGAYVALRAAHRWQRSALPR